ncbi:hypothetical protein [Allonocardiopsis opalescens]|uniref:Uncharacterized protein n=1 Tax=Allonocardiopsis opalescens TaxID=1144618 RepID=A0A2T0QFF8_9ACTN|nr:hypothetical protein [Allonocardiopsis opalescens]PRY02583.1 hypothetical protein CLV72_1011186 [Allonocardiopsis opalescens]
MQIELITAAVTAAAGGVAGEAAKQAWTALTGLVRRAFGERGTETVALEAVAEQAAGGAVDEVAVRRLAMLLQLQAEADPAFGRELDAWVRGDARPLLRTGDGDVANTIERGARIGGSVVQARDIHGRFDLP